MVFDRRIFITSSFIAYHCWPTAPEEVAFLRNLHRHVFKVRVEMAVTHNDRDVEFFMAQRELNTMLRRWNETNMQASSCEMMAESIWQYM